MTSSQALICEPGGSGLVLPLLEAEQLWPKGLRAVLYAVALIYSFVGVSIIADKFMSSLETITSSRKQVRKGKGRVITMKVWNDTVANLSLLALGSSAPEIFLCIVELFRNRMYTGALGASTIVGSAAFNLFVIVAVCIVVIPSDQTRAIEGLPVFYVTAAFSLFAYLWMVFVLSVVSPDVVEVWEALVTFLLLPILLVVSYYVDRWDSARKESQCPRAGGTIMRCENKHYKRSDFVPQWRKLGNAGSVPPIMGRQPSNRGELRRGATCVSLDPKIGRVEEVHRKKTNSEVQFLVDRQCVSEGMSEKTITLVRSYCTDSTASVRLAIYPRRSAESKKEAARAMLTIGGINYMWRNEQPVGHSKSGTEQPLVGHTKTARPVPEEECPSVAEANRLADELEDAVFQTDVVFYPQEEQKEVTVQLPQTGADSVILVALEETLPTEAAAPAKLGFIPELYIEVVAAGSGQVVSFCTQRLFVEGSAERRVLEVSVLRRGDCAGTLSLEYKIEGLTATPGIDFKEMKGELEFGASITEQTLQVVLLGKKRGRAEDILLVILRDPKQEMRFDEMTDGGVDSEILTVKVGSLPDDTHTCLKRIDKVIDLDAARLGMSYWKAQFPNAFVCDAEDGDPACADKLFHYVALPWKVIFTVVPPAELCGGWACFVGAQFWIAVISGFIADLAELFGCVLGIPDLVTAITFVALGTSMPDLFASLGAAQEADTADAAVVNVTGSNSVNVFLGLGLPWTMGALYWNFLASDGAAAEWESRFSPMFPDRLDGDPLIFVAASPGLSFSVLVFSVCCIAALALLVRRRSMLGAELGGPSLQKWSSGVGLVTLWFVQVLLTTWNAMRTDPSDGERASMMVVGAGVVASALFIPVCLLQLHDPTNEVKEVERRQQEDEEEEEEPFADPGAQKGSKAIAIADGAEDTDGAGLTADDWKGVRRQLGKEWDDLMAAIPSQVNQTVAPQLDKVRRDMEAAAADQSEDDLLAARRRGSAVVAALLQQVLDVPEEATLEAMGQDLQAGPETSPWFQALREFVAASAAKEGLATAFWDIARKHGRAESAARLVVARRLSSSQVPERKAQVAIQTLARQHRLTDVAMRTTGPSGAKVLELICQVSVSAGHAPYQETLGCILQALQHTAVDSSVASTTRRPGDLKTLCEALGLPWLGEALHRAAEASFEGGAGRSPHRLRDVLSAVVTREEATVQDLIDIGNVINMDLLKVLVRPLAHAHFLNAGMSEELSGEFADRVASAAPLQVRAVRAHLQGGELPSDEEVVKMAKAMGLDATTWCSQISRQKWLQRHGIDEQAAGELAAAPGGMVLQVLEVWAEVAAAGPLASMRDLMQHFGMGLGSEEAAAAGLLQSALGRRLVLLGLPCAEATERGSLFDAPMAPGGSVLPRMTPRAAFAMQLDWEDGARQVNGLEEPLALQRDASDPVCALLLPLLRVGALRCQPDDAEAEHVPHLHFSLDVGGTLERLVASASAATGNEFAHSYRLPAVSFEEAEASPRVHGQSSARTGSPRSRAQTVSFLEEEAPPADHEQAASQQGSPRQSSQPAAVQASASDGAVVKKKSSRKSGPQSSKSAKAKGRGTRPKDGGQADQAFAAPSPRAEAELQEETEEAGDALAAGQAQVPQEAAKVLAAMSSPREPRDRRATKKTKSERRPPAEKQASLVPPQQRSDGAFPEGSEGGSRRSSFDSASQAGSRRPSKVSVRSQGGGSRRPSRTFANSQTGSRRPSAGEVQVADVDVGVDFQLLAADGPRAVQAGDGSPGDDF